MTQQALGGAYRRWMVAIMVAASFTGFFVTPLRAEVKRVVLIKLDGVPENVLERELARTDPTTGKGTLPWIDRIFIQGGARMENFYVRSISLSTPSWSLLDTGQHLQIRGNAEFDRYTGRVYDYMNFFPFYVGYARSRKVDMPGVEVLDDQKIPLLIDRFPVASVHQSFQLYQRGVRWETLEHALPRHFSRGLRDLLDEWTIGLELGSSVEEQTERELIAKLSDPSIQYLDYFTGDFDHVAHAASDIGSQRQALQRIDALLGRIWSAIQSSPLAAQTMLVAVSDHGMNSEPGVYSQGFNLLRFFNSRAGGAHHAITNRHPLDEFKLSGLDPFVSEVVTPSDESLYLKGEADDYPTAQLDLDGNERAAVSLRSSTLNTLHILLKQINHSGIDPQLRSGAIAAFLKIVERHRASWQGTIDELSEELGAVHNAIEQQRLRLASEPRKWTQQQREAGLDKASRRLTVQLDSWRDQERTYSAYERTLSRLIALNPGDFDRHRLTSEELIPKHAMGDPNSVYDLQNYVAGPAAGGLALLSDGSLDFSHSLEYVNYPPLLAQLSVRNNVQTAVGSHPVDFFAMSVPKSSFTLLADGNLAEDPIWLYSSEEKQALILSRQTSSRITEYRYLPVRALRQDASGSIHFEPATPAPGFPLRLFEDENLNVAPSSRATWISDWHTESEWFRATHQTAYSNAIIALHEQFLPPANAYTSRVTSAQTQRSDDRDAALLARFNQRRRSLVEPDFLVFANDHWNFNVRNFNPGGNHGSFLRASTRSILLFAGGADTGIPRHLEVQDPYDSLSFVPTILELMGMHDQAAQLPGLPIRELLPSRVSSITH